MYMWDCARPLEPIPIPMGHRSGTEEPNGKCNMKAIKAEVRKAYWPTKVLAGASI